MEQLDPVAWREVMAVDVDGVFLAPRVALRHLRAVGGCIVNVGSVAGLGADWSLAAYSTAKGAVVTLTNAMAFDHGSDGVRVNAVHPGLTVTDLVAPVLDNEATMKAFTQRIAMRRPAQPPEVAAVLAFLASEDASFVNDVHIPVDGGVRASSGHLPASWAAAIPTGTRPAENPRRRDLIDPITASSRSISPRRSIRPVTASILAAGIICESGPPIRTEDTPAERRVICQPIGALSLRRSCGRSMSGPLPAIRQTPGDQEGCLRAVAPRGVQGSTVRGYRRTRRRAGLLTPDRLISTATVTGTEDPRARRSTQEERGGESASSSCRRPEILSAKQANRCTRSA